MRSDGRDNLQLREVKFTRNFISHGEGSVLVEFGNTKVICNATFSQGVPRFLKGTGQGWVTAEYGMLPRSTHSRMARESTSGKQSGRTLEIQRLISRSLRAAVDLKLLGENTITIDCDVLQADGGTRTASISGACLALSDSLSWACKKGHIKTNPLKFLIAGVSFGIKNGEVICDLDYKEDSSVSVDMNVVLSESGGIVEIQGTAEKETYSAEQVAFIIDNSKNIISSIIDIQKKSMLDLS